MLFLNLIFTIFCLTRHSATNNAEQQIIAKLVERVGSGAHCGILATAAVNKFIIYRDGKPTNEQIKVAIKCIELYDKSFLQSGGMYKLIISDDPNELKSYILLDKYHGKLKLFTLQKIEKY